MLGADEEDEDVVVATDELLRLVATEDEELLRLVVATEDELGVTTTELLEELGFELLVAGFELLVATADEDDEDGVAWQAALEPHSQTISSIAISKFDVGCGSRLAMLNNADID